MVPKVRQPKMVLKAIKDEKVQMIDLRFTTAGGVAAFFRPAECG